jgi:predicted O-methyltransferase YrrM
MALFFKPKAIPAEISAWYCGTELTPEKDWVTHNLPHWLRIFPRYRDSVQNILEIGSYEGRSAIFFLEYFPAAKLVSVDANDGEVRRRLVANLAKYAGRVERHNERSTKALFDLQQGSRRFDLIYIDGSHKRDQVMIDTLLAWPMLNVGGLMIWDDYDWPKGETLADRPKQAVDSFLNFYRGSARIVHRGYQVMAAKTE